MENAVGSGVITAATSEAPKIAYFHIDIKCLDVTKPVKDNANKITGSWKHKPMYNKRELTNET